MIKPYEGISGAATFAQNRTTIGTTEKRVWACCTTCGGVTAGFGALRERHGVKVASPNCCKSPESRQGNGVGSPKSCKTKKGDLRREKNATAVGGD